MILKNGDQLSNLHFSRFIIFFLIARSTAFGVDKNKISVKTKLYLLLSPLVYNHVYSYIIVY